ncbi:MAG: calcium/sodium antiporter [Deltaproteobacteria bacterium]|nr:calcium/sodium antiporter [Deltaproteobacteria bacterium]
MWLEWARLAVGALLLYLGAEWFVAGASALAIAIRIPQIVIGLTVVAYGTSAPEVIVGIEAALAEHGAVALGNVIGSNIANIGLILGASALVKPLVVDASLRRRELPVLAGSTILVCLLLLDGVATRWEGAGLLVLACLYTTWMIRATRRAAVKIGGPAATELPHSVVHLAGNAQPRGLLRLSLKTAAGLALLLFGGSWFVAGAVAVARDLQMSERVVGLTIVAVGTSLPELVTSLVAVRRGHTDLALGNVFGSNIFNVFLCLGSAALVRSMPAPLTAVAVDLAALAFMTALLALFTWRGRSISRLEGALVLAAYLVVMVITLLRG